MSTLHVDKAVRSCAMGSWPSFPPVPVTRGNPHRSSSRLSSVCSAPLGLLGVSLSALCTFASFSPQLPHDPGAIIVRTLKATNLRLVKMEQEPWSVRLLSQSSSKYLLKSLLWINILCLNPVIASTDISWVPLVGWAVS